MQQLVVVYLCVKFAVSNFRSRSILKHYYTNNFENSKDITWFQSQKLNQRTH